MKNLFIEHVSHEIRTPLNVITGYAQVITNPDYKLDTKMRDHMLQDISRNTVEITNIVNELLEVAQDESREHIDHDEMVAVNDLCRHIIKDMEPVNVNHLDIDFITDITDDYQMKSNKQAIEKILGQLLDNALKFTSEGSVKLMVNVDMEKMVAIYTVEDTGSGIEAADAERIFEPYTKLNQYFDGEGVGLTVARNIAQRLGGELTLDAEYAGPGCRFVLQLPI